MAIRVVSYDSRLRIRYDTRDEAAVLDASYRVQNPAWIQRQQRGLWLGGTAEWLRAATAEQGGHLLTLPRGLADDLHVPIVATACTPVPASVEPYPYQREALDALRAHTQGVIVAPCGSGKTVIGLLAIAERGVQALVIVPTLALQVQWRDEALAILGDAAGLVTVATVQSLWGTRARRPTPLPAHSLLLVDECHHTPSRCLSEVVDRSEAPYRYGLTATPNREDGLGALIGWYIGPVRHAITDADMEACGRLVRPTYREVRTGCRPETRLTRSGVVDHAWVITQLAEDEVRTGMIAEATAEAHDRGGVVLVLTTRVEHAKRLAVACEQRGVAVAVVTGQMGSLRRRASLDAVQRKMVRVLIATQLADEGLDLPMLDTLILALPSRAHGRTVQRVGRIMRPAVGKAQPEIVDVIDDHPMCWGQRSARLRAIKPLLGRI